MIGNESIRQASASSPADYPPSDGVARFDDHAQNCTVFYTRDVLENLFKREGNQPDASISWDAPIYYEQGNPAARVVPDLFVTLGTDGKRRLAYKVWEEGKVPDFVLDVASKLAEGDRDWRGKPARYAAVGVRECWRFDPTGEHFEPRLQGFRWEAGGYVELPARRDGVALTIRSEALGVDLRFDGERLRVRDPRTERVFPTPEEVFAEAVVAEAALYAERRARQAAEAGWDAETKARLRAETDRAEQAKARRRAEMDRDAEARARQRAETARAEQAEARRVAEAAREAEARARRKVEAREIRLERRLQALSAASLANAGERKSPPNRQAKSNFG